MLDNSLINTLNVMDYIQKLEILEKIEQFQYDEESSIKFLRVLSKDADNQVRTRVAEILIDFDFNEVEPILLDLLSDEDELVRTNAADSLSRSKSEKVAFILKDVIRKDKSSMVRAYATLSLIDITRNVKLDEVELKTFFKKMLQKEKVVGTRICFYKALYCLGENEYLDLLFGQLKNKRYQNRCAVVNILGDIISASNQEQIIVKLREQLSVEKTRAVSSSIERVLKNL